MNPIALSMARLAPSSVAECLIGFGWCCHAFSLTTCQARAAIARLGSFGRKAGKCPLASLRKSLVFREWQTTAPFAMSVLGAVRRNKYLTSWSAVRLTPSMSGHASLPNQGGPGFAIQCRRVASRDSTQYQIVASRSAVVSLRPDPDDATSPATAGPTIHLDEPPQLA